MDNISQEAQRVFQYATVIGERFWYDAIDYMADKLTDEPYTAIGAEQDDSVSLSTETSIAYLLDSGLIRQCPNSTYPWTQEYEFTNASLKQVSYGRILKRERKDYHTAAAEWIEQQKPRIANHRNVLNDEIVSSAELPTEQEQLSSEISIEQHTYHQPAPPDEQESP